MMPKKNKVLPAAVSVRMFHPGREKDRVARAKVLPSAVHECFTLFRDDID